ncbi:choice-of-anchor L domain-containing protein [Nitrosomonas communis]|nr:choice-of-anchor L domain-containing protein [Nitrosomonas communis]
MAGSNFALGQTAVFGPEAYIRGAEGPQKVTKIFSTRHYQGEFTLVVQNGEGKRGKVSSAVVRLNGVEVVGPNEFNKQVDLITKPVSLGPQNELTVEVRSHPGSSIIVTILGTESPSPSPISGITVKPDAIFVDEPSSITIKATIPYDSTQGVPVVNLQRVDADENIIAIEGTLTDDGDINNADQIAGDGVFSLKAPFSSQTEGRIRLRLALQQGALTATSNIFYLDVFDHLTDDQLNIILNSQKTALQSFNTLAGSIGREAARDAVLAQLQQDPNVLQAGVSDNANGIWMLYSFGILGGLNLNPDGTRSGIGSTELTTSLNPLVFEETQTQNTNEIKNSKAIILAPFLNKDIAFSPDETPSINQILTKSVCPAYEVTYKTLSEVTVDTIKTLNQYGLIVLATHGDTYYKGLLSQWRGVLGWSEDLGQVVFLTGQTATVENKASYEIDLMKGRLAITSGYYAILPSFIQYYGEDKYPDSIVYIGACRSTFNNTMADAFLSKGAKTYLGYSEYVEGTFATNVGSTFFKRFIENPNDGFVTTGQSYVSGQSDNSTPPAFFQIIGSAALEAPSAELKNGDFEFGNLGAWKANGDGRVLSQLGQFSPVEGSFLGLVSTGLGVTTSSGSIEQQVCLPSKAQLEFQWNFNSEEFIEWCSSAYQDTFRVDVITSSGTQNLFTRRVNDLCSVVNPSNLVFDRSGGACTPTQKNDCTVWSTGWQPYTIDISDIAAANQGKAVKIRFSATDVGDSIFDTAILLDSIKITEP